MMPIGLYLILSVSKVYNKRRFLEAGEKLTKQFFGLHSIVYEG